MHTPPYFDIKVKYPRGDAKPFWGKIGRLFYNPAEGDHPESLDLRLNSVPPIGLECRAFPPDDQPPIQCADRFTLTARIDRGDAQSAYYHPLGTVFHNPPAGDRAENFNILLDSYPLSDRLRAYPATRDNSRQEQAA